MFLKKKINKWYLGVALFIGGCTIIGFDDSHWEKSLYFLVFSAIMLLHSIKEQLPQKRYRTSELVLTVIFLLVLVYTYVL